MTIDNQREAQIKWYRSMTPRATPHGFEPISFADDAPPDFVLTECKRLRDFLKAIVEETAASPTR